MRTARLSRRLSCGPSFVRNLVALLRMNLFTHRDLWAWLDQPFAGPPSILTTTQGELALG
jgi:hypothetical protein